MIFSLSHSAKQTCLMLAGYLANCHFSISLFWEFYEIKSILLVVKSGYFSRKVKLLMVIDVGAPAESVLGKSHLQFTD